MWEAPCQFDTLKLKYKFQVAFRTICTIGADFLSRFEVVIDVKDRCCRLMGKRLPLVGAVDDCEARAIVAAEDFVILPRTEVVLPGSVPSLWGRAVEGVFEPEKGLSEWQDILVAHVMWRVEQGQTLVRIVNVTVEPVELRRGTVLGHFSTEVAVVEQVDQYDACPIKLAPYRVPIYLQGEMQQEIQQMLERDAIQPSYSSWAAPVVLVRKKDGGLRFCVDYRKT